MYTTKQKVIEMDQPNSNKYCGYICDDIKRNKMIQKMRRKERRNRNRIVGWEAY